MNETVQKWLGGLILIGAILVVGQQGKGIAAAFGGLQKFISGTEATAITGKA